MVRRFFMIAMICLIWMVFYLGAAVNVTGNWELSVKMKENEKKGTFTFTRDGEKLTAVMKKKNGKTITGEGTVKGTNIKWKIVQKNKTGVVIFNYTGIIDGTAMKGELVIEREKKKKAPLQWIAKKNSRSIPNKT